MNARLLSVLLVFLLITSVEIPAVSAEPVAVGAGSGIVLDIAKEILNPYTKDIPLILQKHSIEILKKDREKALSDLCHYRSNLADITKRCEENHRAILQEFKDVLRKDMKIGEHPLVKRLDKKVFKKKIRDNIDNYNTVLEAISTREGQIDKLDKLIEEREKKYRIATEDAMGGHKIMEHVRAIELENQQMKKENDKLREIVKQLIKDNKTLLSMLNE